MGFLGNVELSSSPLCTSSQQTVPFKFVHRCLDGGGGLRLKGKLWRFWDNPPEGFARVTATPPSHDAAALIPTQPSKDKWLARQVLVRSSPTPTVSKGEIKKEITVVGGDAENTRLPSTTSYYLLSASLCLSFSSHQLTLPQTGGSLWFSS